VPKKKDLIPTTGIEIVPQADMLPGRLLADLVGIIESRKRTLYRQVNSGVVMMFWEVGRRINEEILKNERAEYGKQMVVTVSRQLETTYGRNFEEKNLRRMMQLARDFSDPEISATLSQQLSWSHIQFQDFSFLSNHSIVSNFRAT
jgi:hypothetical protein